jgi:hypothetical protein
LLIAILLPPIIVAIGLMLLAWLVELHPDFMRRIARRGGRARMGKMSPAGRSSFQTMAAKARWSRVGRGEYDTATKHTAVSSLNRLLRAPADFMEP